MENQTAAATSQYDYLGTNVQIGGGFGGMVPLAQTGSVVISQGELSLFGSHGQLIDKAPLGLIQVKRLLITLGATASVRMNGKRYSVSISHGDFAVGPVTPLTNLTLGASSSATGKFVKIFQQLASSK